MPRSFWVMVSTVLISLAITHGSLWLRGVRPSRRRSLWEHLTWEAFPRDDQQRDYVRQRFLTVIVVLPITALIVFLISERLA